MEIHSRVQRSGLGQVVCVIVQLRDIADQNSRQILLGNIAGHHLVADMHMIVVIGQLNQRERALIQELKIAGYDTGITCRRDHCGNIGIIIGNGTHSRRCS